MKVINFPSKYNIKDFIPARLKQAMEYRGLNKKDFAKTAGITINQLNNILIHNKDINIKLIFKFSNLLNFPVTFFFKPMPQKNKFESILFIN